CARHEGRDWFAYW
nr:immunoglobulin heavy chain junction region [Mus musculus]